MTTFNIALGTKVPGGITVDLDMANTAAIAYLIEYGIKQSLNDAIAAVKITDADYTVANTKAIVEKRWSAILSGNVRQAGTREASDPIGVEAKKIAGEWWKALGDQNRKVNLTVVMKAHGMDEKTAKTAIIGAFAKLDSTRRDAEANLNNRKPVDVVIDLNALGLVEAPTVTE